jgi:hypothetical protein
MRAQVGRLRSRKSQKLRSKRAPERLRVKKLPEEFGSFLTLSKNFRRKLGDF